MAMSQAGIDQTRLAERVGVSRPAVGQWLSGDTEPATGRLLSIAEALGVSIEDLLRRDHDHQVVVPASDPRPGERVLNLDEAALLGMWRKLSVTRKAALFGHLGSDDMPSLRTPQALHRQKQAGDALAGIGWEGDLDAMRQKRDV